MADTIEKVYCTGDGGNDNLAAALLARGRDNDSNDAGSNERWYGQLDE